MTATCTRVLAVLLTDPESTEWFNNVIHPDDVQQQSQRSSQVEDHHRPVKSSTFSNKKQNKSEETKIFKTALLTQIRASLDDPRLRLSALHLMRRVILLREKHANLQVAEHAGLIYQCIDEVGILLVQQASQPKLVGLCCGIYVDFLMNYPMTEKVQQKRVALLIRNLSFPSFVGRRSALSVLHELAVSRPFLCIDQSVHSFIHSACLLASLASHHSKIQPTNLTSTLGTYAVINIHREIRRNHITQLSTPSCLRG